MHAVCRTYRPGHGNLILSVGRYRNLRLEYFVRTAVFIDIRVMENRRVRCSRERVESFPVIVEGEQRGDEWFTITREGLVMEGEPEGGKAVLDLRMVPIGCKE